MVSRQKALQKSTTPDKKGNQPFLYILAFLLPFIAVGIKTRSAADTIINICLLCLGFFPAVHAIIHAFYILLRKVPASERTYVVVHPSSSQLPTPSVAPSSAFSQQEPLLPSSSSSTASPFPDAHVAHASVSTPYGPMTTAYPPEPEREELVEEEEAPQYGHEEGRWRADQEQAYREAQEGWGKKKVA
ncbi:hypothetical protein JCM8547_000594 [Rhodosporidiobolus lusitaniae]